MMMMVCGNDGDDDGVCARMFVASYPTGTHPVIAMISLGVPKSGK